MTNNLQIDEISSSCTTAKELIKSADFMRWLDIVLSQAKTFNREYIVSLFIKLQNDEVLDEEEKQELTKFVIDDKVSKLWQELLSKLSSVSVNVKTNNLDELWSFSDLLKSIFIEGWYNKVSNYVWEVADIAKLTLNTYEWMQKIQIEVNGETKEIYLDNENLRVDSSKWEVKKIGKHNVKINPEWDITEYLDWPEKWQQLFDNRNAAEREAKKMWKRLPFAHDENKEFQAIIDKVWVEEFMKVFPGYRYPDGSDFWDRGDDASFWSASFGWGNAYGMAFIWWDSRAYRYWYGRSSGLSVRLVKD